MWITAITLGLAGSLHCVGMCSPLVTAITARQVLSGSRLIYNSGRILMYGLMGSVVGIIGYAIDLSEFQNSLSIALGALLIVAGLAGFRSLNMPRITLWLKMRFSRLIEKKGRSITFMLGMLNGLLPCGLTSIALAFCITLNPLTGSLYMMLFGISTLPAMTIIPWMASRFNLKYLSKVSMILVGALLLARSFTEHNHQDHPGVIAEKSEIPICQ